MLATKGIEDGNIILVTGIKEQNAPFLAQTNMHPGTIICMLRTVKTLHIVHASVDGLLHGQIDETTMHILVPIAQMHSYIHIYFHHQ